MTPDEEEMLYNELKALPDFDCLPIPVTWFKRFNIPARKTITPREFYESRYTIEKALENKDLPPLIIDEPQKGGQLAVVPPFEEVKVEVINRPFKWDEKKPFPATLPYISESAPNQDAQEQDHE
jgi:hypothetical protein